MKARQLRGWIMLCLLLTTACTMQPLEDAPTPSQPPMGNPVDPPPPVPTRAEDLPSPVTSPPRSSQTRVEVAQWDGERYRSITPLDAVSPPGSSQLRLTFSRPVDRASVEVALQLQPAPVRGYIQWLDDQTMLWYIESLPPRLDFLLGGAVDQLGEPLPGGLPSLRVGEPPTLVRLDTANQTETVLAVLPADIISAELEVEQGGINLRAWFPGTATFDWEPVDYFVNLSDATVRPGRREGQQPRLPPGLQTWQISPSGHMVMGLIGADLVLLDLRGGRQQTFANVVQRPAGIGARHLAWAPDSDRVALLSGTAAGQSDLIVVDTTGNRSVLLSGLPTSVQGSRIAWSPMERFLLVGHLLVDLEQKSVTPLPEGPTPLGFWSADGGALLYTASYWHETYLVDPDNPTTRQWLGEGLPVGWENDSALLIRWSSSSTRYHPPGY